MKRTPRRYERECLFNKGGIIFTFDEQNRVQRMVENRMYPARYSGAGHCLDGIAGICHRFTYRFPPLLLHDNGFVSILKHEVRMGSAHNL